MKTTKKYWLIMILYLSIVIFSCVNQSTFSKADIGNVYSKKLINDNYTPITSTTYQYDGFMTWFNEPQASIPDETQISTGSGTSITVESTYSNHRECLYIYDGSDNVAYAQQYFQTEFYGDYIHDSEGNHQMFSYECYYNVSFWYIINNYSHETWSSCYNSSGNEKFGIYTSSTNFQLFYLNNAGSKVYESTSMSFSMNVWYFITLQYRDVYVAGSQNRWISVYVNYNLIDYVDVASCYRMENIDSVRFTSKATWYSQYYRILIDAIDFYSKYKTNTQCYTQIQHKTCDSLLNYKLIDSTKLFSMFDSIIDKYPTLDNNYRTYFISDNIMNTQYLDDNRILRLVDSDTTQNKYKIIQMYFDDLNETDAFKDSLNQSVYIRVDSLDSSNILINKHYIYLDFNKTDGLLEWYVEWKYGTTMKWIKLSTNPIFHFDDYLNGQNLTSLEVNFHCLLTYNLTQRIILIKTDVVFNNDKNMLFTYDKIIRYPSSMSSYYSTYNTQTRLSVKYIDYFNRNNGSDYLGNRFYTYNNLKGIRTLQTNSTDWYFNFLDAGIFSDDLEYYKGISESDSDTNDDEVDEPDKPKGSSGKYWLYDSYILESDGSTNINYLQNDVAGSEFDAEIDYDFENIHAIKKSARFYYNDNWLTKSQCGDWTFKINIGLGKFELSFNWLRDVIRTIVNTIMVILQFILFCLVVALNYIIMYFIVGIILCYLYNTILFLIMSGLLYVLFLLIILGVSIIWYLWIALQTLYETVLIPLFTWFVNDGLPLLVELFITVWSFILALLLWIISLGQADFDTLYNQIYDMTNTIADFFIDTLIIFVENIVAILFYVIWYVVLTYLCLFRYIIVKTAGYTNRANELKDSYDSYKTPIVWIYNVILKIKEGVAGWF